MTTDRRAYSLQQSSYRLRKNNFDLLRLLFAGTVCLVHVYKLSGYPELMTVTRYLSSEVAVKGFFVISGFLIFMSFERSASMRSYAVKRVRRIYPAYGTVVLLCAIGLIAASSRSIGDYFSLAWVKYLFANLTFLNFLEHTLPGVFATNRVTAVNGALWTLKIEVMFYMAVPFLVFLFRRFGYFPILVLLYCASVGYALGCARMAHHTGIAMYNELGRQLPGQLSYFVAGGFLYYYLPAFEQRARYFVAAAAAALVVDKVYALPLLEPLALATVVVFFGLFFYVGNFGKYGDFSYGVYIIHFPIIQLIFYFGWFHGSPWLFLATVTATTAVGAIAMWHLVEKRFLLHSSHYVAATISALDDGVSRHMDTPVPGIS
ncbi:acyltransferase family protein [Desulfosudis oleivorans]|uniref:Acyltransferase 3 n=1 Tax=Desulfosudis oleivorans (strain DSM 6200 / JCM 39069 / Hxd3) TaxID=96561 RepID=A8ZY99_DESOH|nr:acyltransferase [Desulfosudis oleivorans]ABW67106.1 acyltransferase 3 [Desulfosudis oleivorans Hxd3]